MLQLKISFFEEVLILYAVRSTVVFKMPITIINKKNGTKLRTKYANKVFFKHFEKNFYTKLVSYQHVEV